MAPSWKPCGWHSGTNGDVSSRNVLQALTSACQQAITLGNHREEFSWSPWKTATWVGGLVILPTGLIVWPTQINHEQKERQDSPTEGWGEMQEGPLRTNKRATNGTEDSDSQVMQNEENCVQRLENTIESCLSYILHTTTRSSLLAYSRKT